MSLPDLALQIVYGRLAWALVLAAIVLAVLPTLLRAVLPAALPVVDRHMKSIVAVLTVALLALMALPGEASPAFWLALVFQYPSGLLLGCSVVALGARWQGRTVDFVMPARFALVLAVAGLVLYLDAFGVLALGLYYGGFGGVATPLLACAIVAGCAVAIVRRQAAGMAAAMLIGVLLFSVSRLPTGNLWDALLDPLLWAWALASAIAAAVRLQAARKAALQPTAEPDVVPELVPAHATGSDQEFNQ